MNKPCALVWRFGPQSPGYDGLCAAAAAFGVALRFVTDGELAAKVGDLCAGKPGPAFAPLILMPPIPALVVSGLRPDDGSLSAFLDAVRSGGASFPLRAMVTPTSAEWTFLQLLRELQQEHEAMQNGR